MRKPPGDNRALTRAITCARRYADYEAGRRALLDKRDAAFAEAIASGWAVRAVSAAVKDAGIEVSPSLVQQAVRRMEAERSAALRQSRRSRAKVAVAAVDG